MSPHIGGGLPIVFCDRGCPFTHRVLALFARLGQPYDRREATVGHTPPGLEQYTTSKRIPLLVHEQLVITESRVMLEYLAERYQLSDAYPEDLADRTRHKHAMVLADDYLGPRLFDHEVESRALLTDVLDTLEAATATAPPSPSLLALHLGPLWHALSSWRPDSEITCAIRAREALRRWLDQASALDCVATTATDPAVLQEDLRRARDAGLLPDDITPSTNPAPCCAYPTRNPAP